MKFDLFTSIGVAIAGIVIAFFVTNLLVPGLTDFSFRALDDTANVNSANGYNYADLTSPNPEVFNYEALNPTVEVYVGECEAYDENGECIERRSAEESTDQGENQDEEPNSEANEQENE